VLNRTLGPVVLILLLVGSPARAQFTVDQSQTTSFFSFPIDNWSQTFTPTATRLYALDLDFADGDDYDIRIKDLSAGGYDGPIIGASGLIRCNGGVQHIVFPTPIETVPGHLYDISVIDDTPFLIGDQGVRGWTTDPYPNGTAHFPGSSDDSQLGHDWYFVTYVPEPSSTAVSLLFTVMLTLRRRSPRRRGTT
jgi:hypothetical protein